MKQTHYLPLLLLPRSAFTRTITDVLAQVHSNAPASIAWTETSPSDFGNANYSIIIDHEQCLHLRPQTRIGIYTPPNSGSVKRNALYRDLTTANLALHSKPNYEESILNLLITNAKPGTSEAVAALGGGGGGGSDDPKNELRRLLSLETYLKDSLLRKAVFLVYISPQITAAYLFGTFFALKYDENSIFGDRNFNLKDWGVGIVVVGGWFMASLMRYMEDYALRRQGAQVPRFWNNAEIQAM